MGVLLSGALLVIMLAGIFQVLERTYSTQKGLTQGAEFSNYVIELTQIINNKASCKTAMAGQKVRPQADYPACPNAATDDAAVKWEGTRELVKIGETKNGLKTTKLCVTRVDDAWTLGSATLVPVKLYFEQEKTDAAGGKQNYSEEFYFNARVNTANPPAIIDCIEGFMATPSPAPTPAPCTEEEGSANELPGLSLVHTANHRSFYVSWEGGRCNNGLNGCVVEYLQTGALPPDVGTSCVGACDSWTSTNSYFNCDVTNTSQLIQLSVSSWNGSPPLSWSSIPVRMKRVYDGVEIGRFSPLTCGVSGSDGTTTPYMDEDCNSAWNDPTATTTTTTTTTTSTSSTSTTLGNAGTCTVDIAPVAPGANYNCPGSPAGLGDCPVGSSATCTSGPYGGGGWQSQIYQFNSDPACTGGWSPIQSSGYGNYDLACSGTAPLLFTNLPCTAAVCQGPAQCNCVWCPVWTTYQYSSGSWSRFVCTYNWTIP